MLLMGAKGLLCQVLDKRGLRVGIMEYFSEFFGSAILGLGIVEAGQGAIAMIMAKRAYVIAWCTAKSWRTGQDRSRLGGPLGAVSGTLWCNMFRSYSWRHQTDYSWKER